MPELFSLPYMQNFRCIAADCEDTCCQHWHVRIDKLHYQRMADWAEKNPEEKKRFSHSVILNDNSISSSKNFAFIEMDEKGFCPYLNPRQECSLHTKQGMDILSDICAYFPRIITEKNTTQELTGALSCPEVVRLCLSEDIENHVMLKTTDSILPEREKIPVHRHILLNDDSPVYEQYFKDVQQTFIDIIKLPESHYYTKLYTLASYSHSIATIYFENCVSIDSDVLENYRIHVFDSDYQHSVKNFMQQYENDQPLACIVVYSVLMLKVQQAPEEKLSKMVVNIFDDYAKQLGYNGYTEVNNASEFSAAFQKRYQIFSSHIHSQVEDYLIKYLLNCFYREWFITMPNPFIYIQMLLVRVALLRFIIFSRIAPEMSEQEIKDISVEVIYQFARAVDHNMAFLQVVYEALTEQQMLHFDYSTPLIKF